MNKTLLLALSLAWQLGYTIAVPLVVCALGGKFLDTKFNTSPLFFICGLVLALIVSSIMVWKKIMEIEKNTDQSLLEKK